MMSMVAAKQQSSFGDLNRMTNLVALQNGTELAGDYRIERVLGAGGFGITYLADELALNRSVTIKEYFPSDFAARSDGSEAAPRSEQCAGDYRWGLDRFIEEAQTLAKFTHPNIVRVYRYFRANNTGYMVLHFEEGQSLKAWLKGLGRAPRQKELDQIVAPLLDALDSIHRSDFLHRDIAPDNIIIRKDGQPVLIDFGSARGEIAAHSRTVSALVKPGYSPYEQYAETSSQQGAWTDIYALAATLYHATTGKRPPDAPSRMIRDDYVPAREAAVGAYRAGFLKAIDKALALNIQARPRSVGEWRGQLLAPDPVPEAAAGSAVGAGWFSRTLGKRAERVEAAAKSDHGAAEIDPGSNTPPPPDAPGPQGQILDFVDNLQKRNTAKTQAVAAADADRRPVSTVKIDTPPPAPFSFFKRTPPAPMSPTAAELSKVQATPPLKVAALKQRSQPSPVARPVAGPRVLARAEPRTPPRPKTGWWIKTRNVRGLAFKGLIALGVASGVIAMQNKMPEFGRQTRTATGSVGTLASAANLLPLTVVPAHNAPAVHVLYTKDGRSVLSAGQDGTLKIWSAPAFNMQHSIVLDDGPATSLATFGNKALTSHANGRVVLWDVAIGRRVGSFKRNDAEVWSVSFLDSETRFAAASHDWKVAIWDTTANEPVHIIEAHDNAVQAVSFANTPRGPMIATGGADKSVKLWKGDSFESVRRYKGHSDFVSTLAIRPDGSSLASAGLDGNIRIWSTKSQSTLRRLYGHKGRVGGLAFAPTSDVLVSAGDDGKVRLWDLKGGRAARVLPGTIAPQNDVAVSPDGTRIIAAGTDGKLHVWAMPTLRIAGR
jgi:WD40 repeat protein/serine/threonine protein kinase